MLETSPLGSTWRELETGLARDTAPAPDPTFMKSSSGLGVLPTIVTARVARSMTKNVQYVTRPPRGPALGREEVTGGDRSGVRAQKLPPRRPLRALGCRIDRVPLEKFLDRVRRNDMAEVLERALDSVVAPGQVLARHPDDELCDALHDELPVPAQDRLWRDDRRELVEAPPAESGTAHRKSRSLVVGQPEFPATELRSEDRVLFAEVLEHALLVAVQPTGEDDGQDVEDGGHGARERGGLARPRHERGGLMRSAPILWRLKRTATDRLIPPGNRTRCVSSGAAVLLHPMRIDGTPPVSRLLPRPVSASSRHPVCRSWPST